MAPRRPPSPSSPASIRESSTHALMVVEHLDRRRRPSSLRTRTCRSAKQAICGRCVTTRTCRSRASRASRRPTASPAATADARVDLVEHERGHLVEVGEDAPARQHRARELAARRGLRERERRLRPVPPTGGARRARRRPARARRAPRASTSSAGAGHPELLEFARRSPSRGRRRLTARPRLTVAARRGGLAPRAPSTSAASSASRSSARGQASRAARTRPPGTPSTSASVSPYLRCRAFRAWTRSRTSCSRAGSTASASR